MDALPAKAAPIAAEKLRARIAGSVAQPYEGYASTAELALPELERLGDVTSLLTGMAPPGAAPGTRRPTGRGCR